MIPTLDLAAQYRQIGPELEEAVLATLRSGAYALGPSVAQFEERFAAWCGVEHAVAVSSGTAALHVALTAAGIGPGYEVVTVAMTFVATAAAILQTGATPVFVDIDRALWTIDPAAIEAAITPRTAAIVPVHLHGRLADMRAIQTIASRHGLIVIEDAAQAHGAERDGTRAGGFGAMGCFSFYPGKNLGACGEGGAITTDDPRLAETARRLRDWGQDGKYNHVLRGFNYRMDGVQGAALGVKLRHVDAWTRARRRIASIYEARLAPGLRRAAAPFGPDHACHVYALRSPERDALRARIEASGVGCAIHYPRPVHLQPAYRDLGPGAGALPETEALAAETLSLPLYPELDDAQIARIVAAVNDASASSPSVAESGLRAIA